MKTKKIEALVKTIVDCLDEIMKEVEYQDHEHHHDHDHYHDQDQDLTSNIDQDQDQDQSRSKDTQKNNQSGVMERFLDICESNNFDVNGIDRTKYARSIQWVVENIHTIRNPNSYLRRCFPESDRVRVGFRTQENQGFRRIPNADDIELEEGESDIYGARKSEIEEKLPLLTEEIFEAVRYDFDCDPTTIGDWERVRKSALKQKLIVGKAIQKGIL